jgi:MarR family transcriptional regulator, lower aerobic nicotinate degradation pathway regulator
MADTERELSAVDGLAQLTFLVQSMLERRAAQNGMSLVQLRMLGLLRDRTPTMAQLADRLELDRSSITGLVDRAERRGLVARRPSDTDRRSIRVELTEEGRTLAAAGARAFEADVAELLALLPDADRTDLARLISSLLVAQADAEGFDLFPAGE